MSETEASSRALAAGFGRLIVLVYVVFAVSAGARALFQVATKFTDAPVSFTLSAIAALIYLVAAIAIIRGAGSLALLAVGVELVGVVAVGALSFAVPHWFPEPSVWSHFGSGYGYVPLVLPVVGLAYLLKRRRA
jgi:fumarate reductase subunit D